MRKSKVAVITGAASGIGFELAKLCLMRDMQVVMLDVHAENLQKRVQELKKEFPQDILEVLCDVRKHSEMQEAAVRILNYFDRVDLLINNAGISGKLAPLWELTSHQIQDVFDVNLHGIIHSIQVFLPYLFQQTHRSKIINMASVYSICSGSLLAPYAMTKHAILALSESLFFDLQCLNKPVDVAVVCPSFVSTQLLNSTSSTPNSLQQMISDLAARSRPAQEVAEQILQEVDQNYFYILPDKEVKDYCEQRVQAIIEQVAPHRHSLEKIIATLSQRASR